MAFFNYPVPMPLRLPIDISKIEVYVELIHGPVWDDNNYQHAARINGCVECPECGVLLPVVETIDQWTQGADKRWYAQGYSLGDAHCEDCHLTVVIGFDEDYIIRMPRVVDTQKQGVSS